MVYTYAIFSGFNCSVEPSRIIRVCTIILYVLYHKNMYWYNTQRNTARKWHGFSVGIEIDLVVWVVKIDGFCVDRSWLDFSVRIRIDLVLCGGRKWLGLESGSKWTWFSCRGACQIELFLEWRSKLIWLQCWGRNQLLFCVGYKLTWF